MVEREEVVKEAVIKEFEEVRKKYRELLDTLVELKVPGVIEPMIASTCDLGEVCHGGKR